MNKDVVVSLAKELIEILKSGNIWLTDGLDDLDEDLFAAIQILAELETELDV